MKSTLNKSVSVLAVSIFIMTAPMAQGMRPIAPGENPEQTEIMDSTTVRQKSMMLAENEESAAGRKAQTATDTKGQESEPESGSETEPKEQSSPSKTAPLKPFRPSEEIAAEQAVDFPVDI
jgi:cytoskeletal protein RodZ